MTRSRLGQAFLTALVLFLTACSTGIGSSDEDSSRKIEVYGNLYIPIPSDFLFVSELTDSEQRIKGLTGDILITVGSQELIIPAGKTYLKDSQTLAAPLPANLTIDFYGVAVITCMSRLSTDNKTLSFAGYLLTSIDKNAKTLDLNNIDLDGDKIISTQEKSSPQFIPAVKSNGYTANALASISRFQATTLNPSTPTAELFLTAYGLDWNLAFIGVSDGKGHQEFRFIDALTLLDSGHLSIDSTEVDPFKIPLVRDSSATSGTNTLSLYIVNSKGLSTSSPLTLAWSSDSIKGKENFLVTLTWDNLGDLDLHVWFKHNTDDTQNWHACWGLYSDIPFYDGAGVINLDIDNENGFGPEHFSLFGARNGRYAIAVNANKASKTDVVTSLQPLSQPVNAFVTIETNHALKSYGPIRFSHVNGETYPVEGSPAWKRIIDIEVKDGRASFLEPNLAWALPQEGGHVPGYINVYSKLAKKPYILNSSPR